MGEWTARTQLSLAHGVGLGVATDKHVRVVLSSASSCLRQQQFGGTRRLGTGRFFALLLLAMVNRRGTSFRVPFAPPIPMETENRLTMRWSERLPAAFSRFP